IFTDAAKTQQEWLWVKRQPDRAPALRQHKFHKSQSGTSLVQKLQAIQFTLEEEERISLPDVTERAARAFDVDRVTRNFYRLFKDEHDAFLKKIDKAGLPDKGDREWYASLMLNRLMLIYFIQKQR